jgi:hypothetical protein
MVPTSFPVAHTNMRVFIDWWVICVADHNGRAIEGMKYLRPLEPWDRGFESHSRHGCLSAFILCLCCPVKVAALRWAHPPYM